MSDLYRSGPPTQTPTQKLESKFSMFSCQDNDSSLVSSKMIFGALQFELFRFKIHSLGSKILKFPEFNLNMFFAIEIGNITHFSQINNEGYRYNGTNQYCVSDIIDSR